MAGKLVTRRGFLAQGTVVAVGATAGAATARLATADREQTATSAAPSKEKRPGMQIGFHTGAFNSANFSFEKCLQWAQRNNVHRIECGTIDGASWLQGLGYFPHVALYEDPVLVRRQMEKYGVQFSQIDAAFPMSPRDA